MMAASKPTSSLSKQPHILSTERYLGTSASGLLPATRFAHFGLAFASPPFQKNLGSPLIITRRLIKQKARHHQLAPALTPCKHIISGTISLRSQRFFSPFPRGTCSLSVAN